MAKTKTSKKSTPIERRVMPSVGGSYSRDPKTGEMTVVGEHTKPRPMGPREDVSGAVAVEADDHTAKSNVKLVSKDSLEKK